MRTLNRTIFVIAISGISLQLSAADIPDIYSGMPYREAKTWHEQFMQGNPTKAQRLDAMRSLIIASPVRERGLRQIFRNFEGNYSIDPRVHGVEKSVLMQLSGSKSQAKGYRREVLYAVVFSNDSRYKLVEMNKPLKRSWGNTDADLVIRNNATGLFGRIEVKDYSRSSQYTNLRDLKIQINKMAREGRKTGQLQFWVNRREVIPEIQQYALKRGVTPMGYVSTGRATGGVTISSGEAMSEIERHFYKADHRRAILGASQGAFGAWMLVGAIPVVWKDMYDVWDPSTRSTQTWLRLGEHGSSVLAGSTMVLSGGALATARFAGEGLQSRLYDFGRVGGVASLAALGLSETFLIARYVQGDVLSQEFWTSQWVLGSAGVGSYAGGWLGGLTSTLVLKNPLWGSVVGGGTGGWIGQWIGNMTSQTYYIWKFQKIDQEFGNWVYARYKIK